MPATATRITTRVTPETQALLSRAAALSGTSSINAFVLSAAIEKATHIMEQEASMRLSREDARRFVEALDVPSAPNSKLSAAFRAYPDQTL